MLMMRSLAQEAACQGIRANGIAPGAIRTRIKEEAWNTPEREAELQRLIPYDCVGDAEDLARAALWLASDASDYVAGTTPFIVGGMALYPPSAGTGIQMAL